MKIIILIQCWQGGHGVVARNLKKELEKQKHKVKIISREDDLDSFSLSKGFFRVRKIIRNENYDILYTFDWSLTSTCLGFKNHYACFHGMENAKLSKILQKPVGIIMGKRLIVVGDKLKDMFPKSNLIYNAIDTDRFYDLKKERKYFGWVKRDYDEKNEEEVRKIAKKYNLPFIFAENIPYEKMNEFYNKLKVFASYPPSYTGFNMNWLEAKASGVPIILGNENGIGLMKVLETPIQDFNWKNHVNELLNVFKIEGEE